MSPFFAPIRTASVYGYFVNNMIVKFYPGISLNNDQVRLGKVKAFKTIKGSEKGKAGFLISILRVKRMFNLIQIATRTCTSSKNLMKSSIYFLNGQIFFLKIKYYF